MNELSPEELTRRQREVYDFIKDFSERNLYPPSYREIADACGLSSVSSVHHIIDRLVRRELVRHVPSIPRTLTIVEEPA